LLQQLQHTIDRGFWQAAASCKWSAKQNSCSQHCFGACAGEVAIFFLFMLGIGNFAMHRAVLESGHPLLGQTPWFFQLLGGRFSLVVEYFLLLGTMLMASQGSAGWAWGYAVYSGVNGLSMWLILSGRI
jgi:hypothetical protein